MDIFESLENLPVSESCFEDIITLVEKNLYDRAKEIGKEEAVSDNYWKELKQAVKREGFDKVTAKRSPLQTAAGKQDFKRQMSQWDKEHANDPEIDDYGMQFVPIQKQMEK